MRDTVLITLTTIAVTFAAPACAQTGRSPAATASPIQDTRATTAVGQTKPPSGDEGPTTTAPADNASPSGPAPGMSPEELQRNIRAGEEKQRTRDRASNDLMTRWDFAICIGCNTFAKPFRRVWTNPLRVLAGIPATEDDKRQARLTMRWSSLVIE